MINFERLTDRLNTHRFKYIKPYNTDNAYDLIMKHLRNNNKIAIRGDWDVDGGASAKIIYNYFKGRNFIPTVFFGSKKSHGVTQEDINYCLKNSIDLYIIVDSSSNSLDELKEISNNGTDILIIDHHITNLDYSDYIQNNILMINSTMKYNEVLQNVSAGFLCHIVTSYWAYKEDRTINYENLIWGYVSLISDNCKTDDEYLQDIILNIQPLQEIYSPIELKLFYDKYTILSRSFLVYKFNNVLNNAFRMNRIDLIMDLFFNEDSEIKQRSKDMLLLLQETIKAKRNELISTHAKDLCVIKNDVIFMDLNKVLDYTDLSKNYIENATGLFASSISDLYKKPCVAYVNAEDGNIKGSGRDTANIFPFKDILQQYDIEGGGHFSAIGFKVTSLELPELFNIGKRFSDNKDEHKEDLIIIDYNELISCNYNLNTLLKIIAANNEICHSELKPIYIKFNLQDADSLKEFNKMIVYNFDFLEVKDLLKKCNKSDVVLASPIYSKYNELLINTKIIS